MAEIVGLNKSDAAYLRRLKRAAAKAPFRDINPRWADEDMSGIKVYTPEEVAERRKNSQPDVR